MNFGNNFLKYRKRKGLTQEEIAEKLQVSRQSVSKWETGETVPDLIKAVKIADIFEISLDALCDRETISKLETNQNITAQQDIKLEFKRHPLHGVIAFLVVVMVAILFGVGGYYIGYTHTTSEVYELPVSMNVSNIDFSLQSHTLSCKFVPEVYSEELQYHVIVLDLFTGEKHMSEVVFENGIGSADLNYGSSDIQVILQVSNGKEKRNYIMEDRIYIDSNNQKLSFPELVP